MKEKKETGNHTGRFTAFHILAGFLALIAISSEILTSLVEVSPANTI